MLSAVLLLFHLLGRPDLQVSILAGLFSCHLLRKSDAITILYKTASSTSVPDWTCPWSTFPSSYFICFTSLILFMYLAVFLLIFCLSHWKVISLRELFMACWWLYLFPNLVSIYPTISFPCTCSFFSSAIIPFLPVLPVQNQLSTNDKLKCYLLRTFFGHPIPCNLSLSSLLPIFLFSLKTLIAVFLFMN